MRSRNIIAAIMSAHSNVAPPPSAGVPVNSVAPVISGTLLWGNELTTTDGTWSNSPTGYTYQWKRNGGNIPGATSNTYTTVLADWEQDITCEVTASNGSGSGTPTASNTLVPTTTEASFYHATKAVNLGNANLFVFRPLHAHKPPVGGWPLVLFFAGDGTSNNNTATNANQSMSTSDNLTYTHTPSLFGFRMMVSTIVIKVNGTPVAWGKPGGTIEGTGVTGTVTSFDHDDPNTNSSPTISVTFGSSQSGNTITCDYVRSAMLIEGPPRWANFGETFDNRCVFIGIQNIRNSADYDRDNWDKVVEYAWNNFTINPNRISAAGISRGGRQIINRFNDATNSSVLKTRYQFWIDTTTGVVYTSSGAGRVESGVTSIVCGTADWGGTFTAANYTNIGIAGAHGTGDGVLTNTTPTFAGTLQGNNEPPYFRNVAGGGHTRDIWDGKCFKRLYRVGGATGSLPTAEWDWVDFILKYSRNALERATLHVEQAEKRRYGTEKDIIDYRHALRQVNALSASDEKTALLARLATLLTAIENGGTRWVVNFHSSGNSEASPYANFSSSTEGDSISNILDFAGNSSPVDVALTLGTGAAMAAIGSTRRSHTGGFSKTANLSGLECTSWPIGRITFNDLPTGTYTIRIYHNRGDANFSANPRFWVEVNSEVKQEYSVVNTLIGYIEYTGLTQAQVAQVNIAKTEGNNPVLTMIELYKHP